MLQRVEVIMVWYGMIYCKKVVMVIEICYNVYGIGTDYNAIEKFIIIE